MKVKRHDHTGVPAKACFLRLLCRGISNAPVEASARHIQRCTSIGKPTQVACRGMSTQVHLQRHLKCTRTGMSI